MIDTNINELLVSGSHALKNIQKTTPTGVIIPNSVSGSIYVSGRTEIDRYNKNEFIKVIDSEVDELLPIAPPTQLNVVPFEQYAAKQQEVDDLNQENSDLQSRIDALQDIILEQQQRIDTLSQNIDRVRVDNTIFQNLLQASNETVQSTSITLSNAVQKATYESVRRIASEANVETLISEASILRQQIIRENVRTGALFFNNLTAANSQIFNSRFGDIIRSNNMTFIVNGSVLSSLNPKIYWTDGPFIDILSLSDERRTIQLVPRGTDRLTLTRVAGDQTLDSNKRSQRWYVDLTSVDTNLNNIPPNGFDETVYNIDIRIQVGNTNVSEFAFKVGVINIYDINKVIN